MTEDWEESFLPLEDIRAVLPPVQCDFCHNTVMKPHFVVKHFGRSTKQLAYCDELCEHSHYLNMLRGKGI